MKGAKVSFCQTGIAELCIGGTAQKEGFHLEMRSLPCGRWQGREQDFFDALCGPFCKQTGPLVGLTSTV